MTHKQAKAHYIKYFRPDPTSSSVVFPPKSEFYPNGQKYSTSVKLYFTYKDMQALEIIFDKFEEDKFKNE